MLRPTTDNSVENGDGNTQVGHNSGTFTQGMDPETFVAEMRRKDVQIEKLIAEKEAIKDQLHALERENLEKEIQDLRNQKAGLDTRLAQPAQAFQEHKNRATQIEVLLQDVATQQALGENRIRAALEGFKNLEYAEIDKLLEDSEHQGVMIAANSAYGRGLVAEDAIQWHLAFDHYKRAAGFSDTTQHLEAYARMAWRLQKGAESLKLQEHLLERAQKEFGPKSQEAATQTNNLALVVKAQGRYGEAEALYRQALEIGRATIGKEHPHYATRLNNLAGVVEAQGRYPEAETLFRQALEIGRATIGEGHPSYAIRLNNLAGVVQAQGRYGEAETLYRQALEIGRATIGKEHPHYATRLNNLAGVVEAQGRYPEAETLYRQALEIDRATIGEGHPAYATRLVNLGNLLAGQGKVEEARKMFTQAVAIFETTLPPDHPGLAKARQFLANLPLAR
ncbi:MAG: tetratricopeptide repeat protein [Aliishimia sp.]